MANYLSEIKLPSGDVYKLKDSEKTDEKVKQTSNTEDKEFPIILKNTNNTTNETASVKYAGGVTVNPNKSKITATNVAVDNIKINKEFNQLLIGTGTAGSDGGASASPNRYKPAKWTFNAGFNPADGDMITIKIPIAGHDYGVFLSTNNGTNYYPVVLNGTGRLTTHYPANTYLILVFESSGSATSVFALTGSDSRVTVSNGAWRVVNYYVDGNSGDWNLRQYNLLAQTAITAGHIIGGTDSGYNHVDTTAFDIRYAVLYAGSNIKINEVGSNNFVHHYAINIKNSSNSNVTWTSYKNLYIKGTLSGTTFTPISGGSPFVQDITASDDGYVYYYIGRAYNSTNAMTFDSTAKKIYWYKDGAIREYGSGSGIKNITRSGTTFTATRDDGSTFDFTQQDKYHKSGSWSGLTYTATAVNSADELKFTIPNKIQTNWELNATSGNSPALLFTRDSTLTDWKIFVTSGKLSFQSATDGSTWTERAYFKDNSGDFVATSFTGKGSDLTDLNGSNISSGTVADARIASSIARLASPIFTGTPKAPTAANGTSTTQIATTEFVNNTLSYVNAMRFKGTLGTGGTITALPASHEAGDTYRVITAGTWAGKYCEIGTLIICTTDGTAANDAHWTSVETNEDGAVIGPASSTDNAIARWDGATGRIIQNSTVTINDNGSVYTERAGEVGYVAKNTTKAHQVEFIVGDSGNGGIYDRTKTKWIVYSDTSGNAVLNGNANTATSAAKWTTARTLTIGNSGKSVDGSSNVSWSLADIGAAPAVTGGYLPLSGGTMTGAFNTKNSTWNKIGDDSQIGDIDEAGTLGLQGLNGNTAIRFTTYNQSNKKTGGKITWDGTKFSITSTTAIDASISGNAATATSAGSLQQTAITSLSSFTHTTDLIYAAVAGSNSVADKPSGVDAFGVLSYKTASGWYGQILTASNTGSGIYWRTGTTLSGGWKKLLDSSNYTDYTVTKTGSGATGTWSISITGSSASCTGNAATANKFKDNAENTTKVFYRGDNTWSNTIKQTANAALGIDTNLKIGTARKDLNFDIGNGSGTGINDGYAGGITWGNGTSAYAGIYYQSSGSYGTRLILATTNLYADGAKARMIVQNNGYIGIGTLSPDTLLTVNGNAKADKFIGALQGNADTATSAGKWTTARTLTIGNTGKSVDGSGNVSWSLAEIGAAASGHNHNGTYVPNTSGANDVNTIVNTGIYNITSGSAINTPKGYGYANLLVLCYRKHIGNTTTDWASQIYLHNGSGTESGSATAPGNVLYYRTSSASAWLSWQKAVHAAAAYTKVGDTNKPVYIAEDGTATAISYTIAKSVPADAKFTDTNTTYTFAEGSTNGAFSVTPSGGSAQSISIHGLGTAAYKAVENFAAASHTHSYLANTNAGAADRPIYITGNAASQTTYRMAGTNTTATTGITYSGDLDTGIWYVNNITGTDKTTLYNQSDGVIIANKYSTSWISEIYQDYRTGQLAVRGKNNGTWAAWRNILDSTNYTNYTVTKTGTGASGTWGINITGSAGSVAWANTGHPSTFPPESHTHGNLSNDGKITTAITIAANDYIIIGDNSDGGKIGKGPIFDASTETQCLTKKGTWKTFGTSNLTIGTTASTAMAGNTIVTNVAISANTVTNADYPIVFATSNTGTTAAKNEGLQKSGAKLFVNPSTGTLYSTKFCVDESVTLQYNTTDQSLDFVF